MDLDENRAALAQQLIAVEQELETQILQRTGLWGLGRIRFRASVWPSYNWLHSF